VEEVVVVVVGAEEATALAIFRRPFNLESIMNYELTIPSRLVAGASHSLSSLSLGRENQGIDER